VGIVATHTGDELLAFRPGDAPASLPDYPDLPIIFSCVVARHQGKVLFVFNTWRKGWELPAGLIEPGETPYDAAVRELQEETGQVASSLTFAGMCLLRLKRGGTLRELGTIYTAELDSLQPFEVNEEVSQIMFWDLAQPVEGYVDEISQELCRLVSTE
jgi:8-oxo-dGTP diphosphatase